MKLTLSAYVLRLFCLVLMILIVLPGFALAVDFKDIPRTHPQFLAIRYWSDAEVIQGYSDDTFQPDRPINRAEVLKVILKGTALTVNPRVEGPPFPDVVAEDWFAPFALFAKEKGIIKGDDATGHFSGARHVNLAEFLKMLLTAIRVNVAPFEGKESEITEVPNDAWFKSYLLYSLDLGIVVRSDAHPLEPGKPLTRGEALEIMYLFTLIGKGSDTQFLLDRTEDQLKQIEVYIASNQVDLAKKTSQLGVDLSQQAFKNMPSNNIVLGAAKLARAYDFLVDAFSFGIQKDYVRAAEMANGAITKATEAWEVNNATQPIARHIKDRAREILAQVGGEEVVAED